jgi:hypothetical protein
MKDGVVSGVEGLGEFLHIIIWHLCLLIGPQPEKIRVRTWLTNSKISRTDIQFASSKLTAAMRGSLSGCKVDANTSVYSAKTREQKISEKEYISKHKRMSKSTKGKKGIVHTSSSSRHRIQSLSHGLFSLEMLLVSISQDLFCFLCLSQC